MYIKSNEIGIYQALVYDGQRLDDFFDDRIANLRAHSHRQSVELGCELRRRVLVNGVLDHADGECRFVFDRLLQMIGERRRRHITVAVAEGAAHQVLADALQVHRQQRLHIVGHGL